MEKMPGRKNHPAAAVCECVIANNWQAHYRFAKMTGM